MPLTLFCIYYRIFFCCVGPFTFSWISESHSRSMSVESKKPREACCFNLKVGIFFFLSPFAQLQYARGAMFGPSYWNPRLSTIVPCCKHAFLSHYLPWLDLPWHLLSQHYLSPTNSSPDLAVKGKALTTKSLVSVPGEINFVTLTLGRTWKSWSTLLCLKMRGYSRTLARVSVL